MDAILRFVTRSFWDFGISAILRSLFFYCTIQRKRSLAIKIILQAVCGFLRRGVNVNRNARILENTREIDFVHGKALKRLFRKFCLYERSRRTAKMTAQKTILFFSFIVLCSSLSLSVAFGGSLLFARFLFRVSLELFTDAIASFTGTLFCSGSLTHRYNEGRQDAIGHYTHKAKREGRDNGNC